MVVDETQISEVKDILGDKTKEVIDRYLLDTQMMFSEIDMARAMTNDDLILEIVHALKSSSFQVGAHDVMEQSKLIEKFMLDFKDKLGALHHQSRLDHMISVLRERYALYQEEIFNYV